MPDHAGAQYKILVTCSAKFCHLLNQNQKANSASCPQREGNVVAYLVLPTGWTFKCDWLSQWRVC